MAGKPGGAGLGVGSRLDFLGGGDFSSDGAVVRSDRLDFRRPDRAFDARAGEILRDDDDLPNFGALTDAGFARWRDGSREDWAALCRPTEHPSPSTCVFDVFERSSGTMIGVAGFHALDADASRAYPVCIERPSRRRGYARECWEAMADFCAGSDLAFHLQRRDGVRQGPDRERTRAVLRQGHARVRVAVLRPRRARPGGFTHRPSGGGRCRKRRAPEGVRV